MHLFDADDDHGNAPGAAWRATLRTTDARAFAAAFTPGVTLETALFDGTAAGPAALRTFFNATQDLYERSVFTREIAAAGVTVLEWEGTAFFGLAIAGVTLLMHDEAGRIAAVQVLHRPYAMVRACAAALAPVLDGQLGPGVRWRPD